MWEAIIAILMVVVIISFIVEFIEFIIPVIIIALVVLGIYSIYKAIQKKENDRIASVMGEVDRIISRYTPNEVIFSLNTTSYSSNDYLNTEVIDFVGQYKNQLAEAVSMCETADQSIKKILACEGYNSPDEKLEYLNKSKYELERLKIESDKCHRKAESRKIRIICNEGDKTSLINEAVLALFASKKCTSATADVKAFVEDKQPAELALFQYEQKPAIFAADGFYFCVFGNIILVFDKNGVFSSALDAAALKITVDRKKTKYRYDRNIDTDSASIVFDEQRAKWLHERKDGHRDMRYKDNQIIEYTVPVSGFEYGIISISIGSHSAVFSVSSSAALGLFERIGKSLSAVGSIADIMCIEEIKQEEDEPASLSTSFETKNRR